VSLDAPHARLLAAPSADVGGIDFGGMGPLRHRPDRDADLAKDVSPSDATLATALFSDALIFEVIAIIGVYMMTARIVGVSGCEVDEVAVSSWETESRGRR
jgi:hypothetical protein